MMLNESAQQYKQLIKEELGITNEAKLNWMSQMAQIQAIKEGVQPNTANVSQGIYATPLNTLGAGNPVMPQGVGLGASSNGTFLGNNSNDFHNPAYVNGSGDVPMSTLAMSLEIAAVTIGFDLVPVVPAAGPWAMLTFNDYPYAGGKLGRAGFETAFDGKGPGAENKPIYIKLNTEFSEENRNGLRQYKFSDNLPVVVETEVGTINGIFIGFSRVDDNMIIKIENVTSNGSSSGSEEESNISIAEALRGVVTSCSINGEFDAELTDETMYRAELVKGVTDHVQGFANFYGDGEGANNEDPMTRAQNETGVGNTIGARIFSKMIHMGAYEVTGAVTRQQLQDYPLYGIDVIGGVLETCQNEISQHWNNRILDRVFKLGVENYKIQKSYQKADLNLYIAGATDSATKSLKDFDAFSKYVGIDGKTVNGETKINNATRNTSAENVTTHQRRIMSRCLAASNLISSVTRKGRAQWIVCNAQILTALQDCSQFVVAPMANNLVQGGDESLYFAGTLAGMSVYVDPNMDWTDTRICVGRKASVTNNKVNGSGVVFMPYILADTVQIVAEGTMAPKLLVNSRAAVVDAGFYPEQNYYTFMVDVAEGMII